MSVMLFFQPEQLTMMLMLLFLVINQVNFHNNHKSIQLTKNY